jgi:membrane protease YdiL (CAAX protease family)
MSNAAFDEPTRSAYVAQTPWKPAPALLVAMGASLAPILVGIAFVLAENHGLVTPEGRIQADGSPSLSSPYLLGQMIAGQLLSLSIIWAAAGWRGARGQTLQLAAPQTDWLTAIGYGLLLVVAIGPIEVLLYRLAGIGLFTDGRWLLEGLRSPLWWGVAFAAVVLAPLWEELTFRGFLLSALAKSALGFWPAALLSSALWTLLHWGYSWPGLVSVFLAGLGLSWIMKRTGSMRAVVIAHSVINACSLTVIYLFAPAI